jgi:aspartyl-tRNA(Asn)/glutamyl-tRNA(Gln) amidotransferase subunit B
MANNEKVMIGLESHGYLNTKKKLFCNCKAEHGLKHFKPNTSICPICTGQPGSKPMLPNSEAITKSIQIALILNCKVNEKLPFQRKHYSWSDLPKGYQNTLSGPHAVPTGSKGKFLGIGITECHLEEDPAAWNPETGQIDYNRSGSPLIEIVTDPDFTSSEQVVDWLKKLKTTLSYIKALDKESGFKADVNISLPDRKGVRIEIKNVNSITNIKNAIETEIKRQMKDVPKEQETRRYDDKKNITTKMRSKENAEEYRFISDPDLPVIKIDKQRIQKLKSELPETPEDKLKKLIKKHKIPKEHAQVLTKKLEVVELFEQVIEKVKPSIAIPWITIELFGALNYVKKELDEIEIESLHFIELLQLVEKKTITELKAKEILRQFIPKSFSPKAEAKKHAKISGKSEIDKFIKEAIKKNPQAAEDYKSGKKESINFLIGQVMRLSNKRADFKTAKELLEKALN